MLELLGKHHNLWLQMLSNLGCEPHSAKDIVQEMYLRLHRLVKDEEAIKYGDDINRYFVYKVLKNMYITKIKQEQKYGFYELFENDDVEDSVFDMEEINTFKEISDSFDIITSKLSEIVDSWNIYDKRLFELYFVQGLSLRKISKGSGIGLNSIHNSIQNYRKILKNEVSEDLEDYFNKDYTHIK